MAGPLVSDRTPSGGPEEGSGDVRESPPWTWRLRSAGLELLLLGSMFVLYHFGRALARGQEAAAFGNAELVRDIESALWLPSEAAIQDLFDFEGLLRVANVYYTGVHFPLMIVFLVWGFVLRTRQEYRWARNLLAIQTGAALVIHVVFPLAPPRMFPEWGFMDSMTVLGPSPYEVTSGGIANQFAAMPSLHVGWAVAIAYIVTRTGGRLIATIAWAHAVLTTFIVIVTANHWWLDGIIAVALLALAANLVRLPTDHPRTPHRRHQAVGPV